MIYYFVTADNSYTMMQYLDTWGEALAGTIEIFPYDKLWTRGELAPATCIFGDLERLTPAEVDAAAQVWETLSAYGGLCLHNHPALALRRYELLREFHARGWNRFRPYRMTELDRISRFPVFLRGALDHTGNLTGLLQSRAEIQPALRMLLREARLPDELLAVEFCDTRSADGLYRKYSAFAVGGRIVPRTMLFSRNWMIKHPELENAELAQEALNYVTTNPHEAQIKEVFRSARVGYGRIDYGLLDGRLQVWEINTNPVLLLHRRERYAPCFRPVHELFARRIKEAFEAINRSAPSDRRIPIAFRAETVGKLTVSRLTRLVQRVMPRRMKDCLRSLRQAARLLRIKKLIRQSPRKSSEGGQR